MKFYWLFVLAIDLADGVAALILFRRGGGPEATVWWILLIIPILIACLIGAGILYQVATAGTVVSQSELSHPFLPLRGQSQLSTHCGQ